MIRPAFSTVARSKFFAARPVHRVVPGFRRGAEAEEFYGVGRDAALGEIIAGELAGGFVGQAVLPARRELFVDVEQLVLEMARFLRAGRVFKFQRNLRALGQPAHGVHEADVFVFLDEGEHVAALVAAEAVEDLLVRIDVEAGRLFLVERAERGEIRAGFFQRQIRADDIHDVAGGANSFAGGGGKKTGHGATRSGMRGLFGIAGVELISSTERLSLMNGPRSDCLKMLSCTSYTVGMKSPL